METTSNDAGMAVFGRQGTVRALAGNRPILLLDPDRVWRVEGGHVDVFAVEVEGGEARGVRQNVFRAGEGAMLFGHRADSAANRPSLLASGTGVTLRELSREQWLAAVGADPAAFARVLADWVDMVAGGIAGEARLPRKAIHAGAAAATLELKPGESLRADAGLVWVRVESGSVRFMGRKDWPEIAAGLQVPLAGDSWLEAETPSTIKVQTFGSIGNAPREFWPAWDAFVGFILDCIRVNRTEHVNRELERMRGRARLDRSLLHKTLDLLGFVLGARESRVQVEVSPEFPMFAAARMVGANLGINVEQPETNRKGIDKEERIIEIARVSRFRTREVLLSGEWWRQDNGPILAFLGKVPGSGDEEEEDGEPQPVPVALVPVSPTRYDLCNPVTGERLRVTKEVSERLAAKGHSFYRPLPNAPVTGRMLVAHGLRGCGKDILVMIGLGLVGGLLGLLIPLMTGLIFDSVIPQAERGQLVQIAAILVTSALVTALFSITKGIALVRVEARADGVLQAAVCDRVMSLPVPFFHKYTAGDLADRMMGINAMRIILSGVTANTVLMATFASFNLVLLFLYSVTLAWVGVVLSLLAALVVLGISSLQIRYRRPMMDLDGRNAGTLLQFITGIAKLRITGTEDRAFSVWAGDFAEKMRLSVKVRNLQNILTTFSATFPVAATMVIYACMMKNRIEVGPFLAFFAAYTAFQAALLQMSTVVVASLDVIPLYDRIRPILETLPEVHDAKKKPGELSGDIEVMHVDFRYSPGSSRVLKNVSMRVRPGEMVAVVGSSGSGKSTLLRILLGFDKPEAGAIYYDGQDLATIDLLDLRRQFGVVLQNGALMQGDIRSNILGSSNLTLADAWEAARMVGIDEDIRQMPMGMNTLVQAGGGGLSGGQRQRVMIARAIVNRPRILFFDEATSALDNRAQALVSRSLDNLHVSRVVIAHRLSTIINADRIYVLQAGEVQQCGTYGEMMKQDGLFRELATRQIA